MCSTSASNAVLPEKWSVLEIRVSRWSQGLCLFQEPCAIRALLNVKHHKRKKFTSVLLAHVGIFT